MSFSDLVFNAVARVIPSRDPQSSPNALRAWIEQRNERKKERDLAESDRLVATAQRDIDYTYKIAAYDNDLPALEALLRHEDRVGSRGLGRELALLNLCYASYDRVANDLGTHGFIWENNIPAVKLLLPHCDLNRALSHDRHDTVWTLVSKHNPAAAHFIMEHYPHPLTPALEESGLDSDPVNGNGFFEKRRDFKRAKVFGIG